MLRSLSTLLKISRTPLGSIRMASSYNSLFSWTGPYGGVPPFDQVKVDQIAPALKESMDLKRAELARITESTEPVTFDNTLAAVEDVGRAFSRVNAIYGTFTSAMNNSEMQKIEEEMSPILSAFSDEITQNVKLFDRIRKVYEDKGIYNSLNPEQQRLAFTLFDYFARTGAGLSTEKKLRLTEINQKLASLTTKFSQNVLAEEEKQTMELNEDADFDGLPEDLIAGLKTTAKEKNSSAKGLIINTRSSVEPFLTYSTRRDLREKAFRMWVSRGDTDNEYNNHALITEILQLRAEKANLLGYETFAHWVTAGQMAKVPDAALSLMMQVWKVAVARVHEEVADMRKFSDKDNITIEPWDYRFYAEKVRKERYDLSEDAIKPYLELEQLREGMFWMAGQLFGLEFSELQGIPVYHPDMRVFEVKRGGEHVGLWYFDPYARAGKNSGAWMSSYREQERMRGPVSAIVSNNSNFVKAAPGEPVLLSWSDAITMFHEFGHALHGLNSDVTYPMLSGTNVLRDFVEFPSQLMERWLPTREILTRFAKHYKTGEPMPQELAEKIEKARTFNLGFQTVEYLSAAIADLKLHLAGNRKIDAREFEKECLAELQMPKEIVMRHRLPHFSHIFATESYASGYYDYIWADTLTADAAEAFTESPGGYYDKDVAKRLHDEIMSVGNKVDPAEAFRRFRGRDVRIGALMRDRGFPDA